MKLNQEQLKAVKTNQKAVFLLAGAGSGKTTVIIQRIKHLLEKGINPESILVLSFTSQSAKELLKRIDNPKILSKTFHSFCLSYLENKKINPELKSYTKDELLMISKYKNSLYQKKKPNTYTKYQKTHKEDQTIDFDDVLLHFLNLKEKPNFDYIFIDEFQDTNFLQYQILKTLTKEETNLFTVGDPDQSIYAFRGSNIKIINTYTKDYKAITYKLTLNYRSYRKIIKTANNLIKYNKKRIKKDLIPTTEKEGLVKVIITKTPEDKIIEILKKQTHTTILYRNYQSIITLKERLETQYFTNYQLMTIHASKGLEFEHVIIIGLEMMQKTKSQTDQEEERRLLFVAITRAKKTLHIICVKNNNYLQEITDSKTRLKTIK